MVCDTCGLLYGTPSLMSHTLSQGSCDVCGTQQLVTCSRNFGWLQRGIDVLKSGGQPTPHGTKPNRVPPKLT